MKIIARKSDSMLFDKVDLWILDYDSTPRRYASNIMLSPVPEDRDVRTPLSVDMTEAQSLMDTLWECGLRPSEGTGSAGAMAAVQAHLADMRKVADDHQRLSFDLVNVVINNGRGKCE